MENVIKNRRRKEAYRLRIYIDAIKAAEAMTDSAWMEEQIYSNGPYMPRLSWIEFLRKCALIEANALAQDTLEVA